MVSKTVEFSHKT